MKVDVKPVEKKIKAGMFKKRDVHGVALTVTFNEEELATIKERQLEHHVIIDRSIPADLDPDKVEAKNSGAFGIAKNLAKAAIKGTDSLTYNLTVTKLLNGTDTYYVGDVLTNKQYIDEIKEGMTQLKHLIEASQETPEDTSFEL